MTPQELESLWNRAQGHEATGDLDSARKVYREILDSSPRQIMVLVRLSELEQRAGLYREARMAALQAAEVLMLTKRWEALPFVTSALLVFDERVSTSRLIGQADWSDIRVASQSPVLSQQLWLCGEHEAALRLLDFARARGARDHRVEYSRAMALQQLGRLKAATDSFEECIRLAPHFAPAHWSLAFHSASTLPGSRSGRIRDALALSSDRMDRAMLHYALYRELDNAGDTENAWQQLEYGAAVMKTALATYSNGATVRTNVIEPRLQAARAGIDEEKVKDGPIFIVGMPRTGTTLLSRIVGSHPDIVDTGETNSLEHAISTALNRFIDLPLSAADVESLHGVEPELIAGEYQRRMRQYVRRPDDRILDKNPSNVYAADIIAGAIPGAKIICMVRGAMDTGYSNLRQLFQNNAFAYSYDQFDIAEQYGAFRQWVARCEQDFPGAFQVVHYEMLVQDPVTTARQVFEFLGLDFEPAYTDITANTTPSDTASASQVREPIHGKGLEEWRRYERHLEPMRVRFRQLGFDV